MFSGADGSVLHRFQGQGEFGDLLSAACDVNDDGHADVLVGAPRTPVPADGGTVSVFDGKHGRELLRLTGSPADGLLSGAARAACDSDGRGGIRVIVGALHVEAGGPVAHVYSLGPCAN